MKRLALLTAVGLLTLGSASAQEFPRFTFSAGGGLTTPVGATGRPLKYGWNARGGIGYNFSSHLGVNLNVGWDSLGLNGGTLTNYGIPGGDINMLSATIDPIVHLTPNNKHYDFYVTGGGGFFHREQSLNVASTGGVAPISSAAFFGGSPALANYSVNKPGFDAGAGVAFGSWGHGKFFAEARWEHMFMNNSAATDLVPATFGFRW